MGCSIIPFASFSVCRHENIIRNSLVLNRSEPFNGKARKTAKVRGFLAFFVRFFGIKGKIFLRLRVRGYALNSYRDFDSPLGKSCFAVNQNLFRLLHGICTL